MVPWVAREEGEESWSSPLCDWRIFPPKFLSTLGRADLAAKGMVKMAATPLLEI
jgi:hypothetical protein